MTNNISLNIYFIYIETYRDKYSMNPHVLVLMHHDAFKAYLYQIINPLPSHNFIYKENYSLKYILSFTSKVLVISLWICSNIPFVRTVFLRFLINQSTLVRSISPISRHQLMFIRSVAIQGFKQTLLQDKALRRTENEETRDLAVILWTVFSTLPTKFGYLGQESLALNTTTHPTSRTTRAIKININPFLRERLQLTSFNK